MSERVTIPADEEDRMLFERVVAARNPIALLLIDDVRFLLDPDGTFQVIVTRSDGEIVSVHGTTDDEGFTYAISELVRRIMGKPFNLTAAMDRQRAKEAANG